MAQIQSFEDIEAWQKARILTRLVYNLSGTGNFAKDYALKDQIRRASISIMSNIAEGFDRDGNKEFRQFLTVAKGSTSEVRSQLYIAFDAELITKTQFEHAYKLTKDVSHLIGGFLRYLKSSDMRGNKYSSNP